MNSFVKFSLIAVLATALSALGSDPKPAPAPPPPRSVFTLPMSSREGRDPFFPESQRLYEEIGPRVAHTVDTSSFVIHGSSWQDGRRLVIINNHTFAAGDEGDVITADKVRVHLRVIRIHDDIVVIEANGTKREIKIANSGAK
jgi:hypothetical protein